MADSDERRDGGDWGVERFENGKREKLGELRLEVQEGQATLEDAATHEQRLDIDLINEL
jgi:hypothetical protein